MPDGKDVSIKIRVDTSEVEKLKAIPGLLSNLGAHARKMSSVWSAEMRKSVRSLVESGKITKEQGKEILKSVDTSYSGIRKLYERLGISSREYTEQVSHDNSRLAQYARQFAKNWGVSFEDARSFMRGIGVTSRDVSNNVLVDLKKGEQYAQSFAKNWGVSLDDARGYIERLGLHTKRFENVAHHDIDAVAKQARTFAKEWGVSFKEAYDYMQRLGLGTKKVAGGIAYHLTFIAWHFRYLGNLLLRIGNRWKRVIEESIETAAELQESFLSIEVAAKLYGSDAERATELSKKLALTGLLPLTDAATDVMRLMVSGLGVPTAERLLYRALDVGTKYTSGMDEMSKTLDILTKSILRGQLVMSEQNTVARMVWNTTKDMLKTRGIDIASLSKKQRAIALLNTIETKYADTLGLHKIEEKTLRAEINKMKTSIMLLKDAYGKALAPIVGVVADKLRSLAMVVTSLMKRISPTVAVLTVLGMTITTVSGAVSFLIGGLISVTNIMKGLAGIAGVTLIPFSKVILIGMGVGAALTGLTYLILKHTGAWEKLKKQYEDISQTIINLGRATEEAGEMATGITEKERIAHERRTADILEDLERERAKGLWANQMRIKDLEKQLRREQEDWELLQKEKGEATEEGNRGILGNITNLLDNMKTEIENKGEEIKSAWSLLGVESWDEFKKMLTDSKFWEALKGEILKKLKKVGEVILQWWRDTIGSKEWRTAFADEFAKHMSFIGDTIKALFKGVFGDVFKGVAILAATVFATTFASTLMKEATAGGVAYVGVSKAGALLRTALVSALGTTFTITVVLEVGTALYQAAKLREILKGMWEGVEDATSRATRYANFYFEQWRKGLIDFETLQKRLNQIRETQEIVARSAEEAQAAARRAPFGLFHPKFWTEELPEALGLRRQFGGIVPGMRNQPVPIIAHGGERIIPAGEVATGGGNITVNINNPVVRTESDIQQIAQAVSFVLGQRQRFSKLGAF